jgi:hypothetical protein
MTMTSTTMSNHDEYLNTHNNHAGTAMLPSPACNNSNDADQSKMTAMGTARTEVG